MADLTRVWVQHALGNGVEHILLYVDSEPVDAGRADGYAAKASASGARHWDGVGGWVHRKPSTTFEAAVADVFASEIRRGVVELVMFNQRGRDPFETQQMMESHCIWRCVGHGFGLPLRRAFGALALVHQQHASGQITVTAARCGVRSDHS